MIDPASIHIKDFRRIQMDLSGAKKILLVSEFLLNGESWFLYTEKDGDGQSLLTTDGKLNYIQFRRGLEENGRSAQ